jgi:hypothetical protein
MSAPGAIYLPSGDYTFTASYLGGLWVRHDPGLLSWDGTVLQFIIAGPPDALCIVTFKDMFQAWSSNRYSLDYILESATYEYPPNPTKHDLPFYVQWMIPPDHWQAHLLIDTTYGAQYSSVPFPSAPPGYWLPPPLP